MKLSPVSFFVAAAAIMLGSQPIDAACPAKTPLRVAGYNVPQSNSSSLFWRLQRRRSSRQPSYLPWAPQNAQSSSEPLPTSQSSSTLQAPSTEWKQRIVDLVNQARANAGIPALRRNSQLEAAAQKHAEDMLANHYFSHTGLDGSTPIDRIKAEGYGYPNCTNCRWSASFGENIASGQTSPEQVMNEWMNSPEHRENILSPNFDDIGIGIFGTEWVQDFGSVRY